MDSDGPPLYQMALIGIAFEGWDRFSAHFSSGIGDGSIILFWHDRWCEESPIRELFHALFVLTVDMDASVAYSQE